MRNLLLTTLNIFLFKDIYLVFLGANQKEDKLIFLLYLENLSSHIFS
jgi:hypothetical protein